MHRTTKLAHLIARLLDDIDCIHEDDPSKLTTTSPSGNRTTYWIVGVDLRKLR